MEKVLRVLYVASEAGPYIKIGGLGDVAGTLPPALSHLTPEETQGWKLDVRLVIPYHPEVAENYNFGDPTFTLKLKRKSGVTKMDVYESKLNGMQVYFLDGALITEAETVYSFDPEEDMEKFAVLSFGVLELCRVLEWQPHILNANDWHTALSVYALKQARKRDSFFRKTKSVFTVHNLPYMGAECKPLLKDFGCRIPYYFQLPRWARSFAMPLGLVSADHINAVSPNYAQEIQTSAFGCSLEKFLSFRSEKISGIVNGLDVQSWDPKTDPALVKNYEINSLEARKKNKLALLKEFNLKGAKSTPLVIIISRMDHQKGMGIAFEGLRKLTDESWQAIILGTGRESIEEDARQLEKEFPDRVRAAIRFDGALARRMYAGGDMILLPSRYEPCGLTQLIGMRYGCVPVAHAVGGFADTIVDNRDLESWTGFLFRENTPEKVAAKMTVAFGYYHQPETWQQIQKNGMMQDFSWKRSALKYLDMYLSVRKETDL